LDQERQLQLEIGRSIICNSIALEIHNWDQLPSGGGENPKDVITPNPTSFDKETMTTDDQILRGSKSNPVYRCVDIVGSTFQVVESPQPLAWRNQLVPWWVRSYSVILMMKRSIVQMGGISQIG
jgi:hypothetical protein